jgi:hypothetical protein
MGDKFVQTAMMPIADFETTITPPLESVYTEDSTHQNGKSGFMDSTFTIVSIMSEASMKNFVEKWAKAINESGIVFLESSNSHTAGCCQVKTSPTTKKNDSGDGSTGSSSTKTS